MTHLCNGPVSLMIRCVNVPCWYASTSMYSPHNKSICTFLHIKTHLYVLHVLNRSNQHTLIKQLNTWQFNILSVHIKHKYSTLYCNRTYISTILGESQHEQQAIKSYVSPAVYFTTHGGSSTSFMDNYLKLPL